MTVATEFEAVLINIWLSLSLYRRDDHAEFASRASITFGDSIVVRLREGKSSAYDF
jgi:hypothetical protein